MLTNNSLNILPFYDELDKQHHRLWYAWEGKYILRTPAGRLLPFQIPVPDFNLPIVDFRVFNMDTETYTDITTQMQAASLTVLNLQTDNYPEAEAQLNPSIDNTRAWGFSIGDYNSLRYVSFKVELVNEVPPNPAPNWNVRAVLYDERDGTELATYNAPTQPAFIGAPATFTADFGSVHPNPDQKVFWLEIRSSLAIHLHGDNSPTLNYTPAISRYGTAISQNIPPPIEIGTAGQWIGKVSVWGEIGYDIAYYSGSAHGVDLPLGMYWAEMTIGEFTYYSEVYTLVDDISNLLKITYSHRKDFLYPGGRFIYVDDTTNIVNYFNTIYLDSDIARPVYQLEQEVNDSSGILKKLRQVSYIEHKFRFLAPKYFIDAFRIVSLHHDVTIEHLGYTYKSDDFNMEVEWLENGDIANVTVTFRSDTVVIENGDNLVPLPPSSEQGFWTAPDGNFWTDPDGNSWVTP